MLLLPSPRRPRSPAPMAGSNSPIPRSRAAGTRTRARPGPGGQRTWTTYNYSALWMGMAHNIPSYLLASGLIALGMNWLQAFLTITLGNLIVLVPMLLNSHAGTKYGIPFPVFARAFYGVRGANLPGAAARVHRLRLVRHPDLDRRRGDLRDRRRAVRQRLDATRRRSAGSRGRCGCRFAVFWVIQMALIWRGMEALRRFENWAAPLGHGRVPRAAGLRSLVKAGGLGPILDQPSKLGWGTDFWKVFCAVADGHDRVLGDAVAEHAGLHPLRRAASAARCWGQIARPADHDDVLRAARRCSSPPAPCCVYGEAIWDPVAARRQVPQPGRGGRSAWSRCWWRRCR